MNIKSIPLAVLAAAIAATTQAAVPRVSNTQMTQAANRLVTITYELADGPAVITLDIETNVTGTAEWVSIGGANIQQVTGDVWKKVETGSHTIQWRPDLSWPDHKIAAGGARAAITAWALDNTPDYMVVDVSSAAQPDTQTYYPAADFVPGGVTNGLYKTTMLLMRKIMAKDVKWTMGSTSTETQRTAAREGTHQVTLTNNYYIGVYPVTQSQWGVVATNSSQKGYFTTEPAMRPMEQVCYNEIRNAANTTTANASYNWPNGPNPSSFLGLLRSKTGLDFDLPSEAQWEFAARAGNGVGYWGDGSAIKNANTDANLNLLGRYQYNGGKIGTNSATNPAATCEVTNGTAVVGSYAPNAWGLYDTAGNVWEWCLDWYEDDITAHGGKVNIDPATPANTLSDASGANRVLRGGSLINAAGICRPAFRSYYTPATRLSSIGFRVLCSAGLQ